MKTTKTVYTVSNAYGIAGTSNHRTPEAALEAASKREGNGWEVNDSDGNKWSDVYGVATIV